MEFDRCQQHGERSSTFRCKKCALYLCDMCLERHEEEGGSPAKFSPKGGDRRP